MCLLFGKNYTLGKNLKGPAEGNTEFWVYLIWDQAILEKKGVILKFLHSLVYLIRTKVMVVGG